MLSQNVGWNYLCIQKLQWGRLLCMQSSKMGLDLNHWGQVMRICISILAIIGSDNGLEPGQCQACIIWTNAAILSIQSLGTNFSEILFEIHIFAFKKMHLKFLSGKCRPSCLGLDVLIHVCKWDPWQNVWANRVSEILVNIGLDMACHLLSTQPSPRPMLTHDQLHSQEQTSVKF